MHDSEFIIIIIKHAIPKFDLSILKRTYSILFKIKMCLKIEFKKKKKAFSYIIYFE